MAAVEESLKLLCSSAKIERDRGAEQLKLYLKNSSDESVHLLEKALNDLFLNDGGTWESRHGALMGTRTLLSCQFCSDAFIEQSTDRALKLLEHDESRVRLAAGLHIVNSIVVI